MKWKYHGGTVTDLEACSECDYKLSVAMSSNTIVEDNTATGVVLNDKIFTSGC